MTYDLDVQYANAFSERSSGMSGGKSIGGFAAERLTVNGVRTRPLATKDAEKPRGRLSSPSVERAAGRPNAVRCMSGCGQQ
jgi:hypothetical protein